MRLVAVALVFFLSGCVWLSDDKGVFVDNSDDYLDATENPELIIPTDLDNSRVQDPFPIPEAPIQTNASYFSKKAPRPNAIYAKDNRDAVRIQRLSERRWLVIPESPTTVWPKVKQFLAENGITITNEMATRGRLDTEWLTVSNEAYRDVVRLLIRDAREEASFGTGRDRLRIRVEQGLREHTSEIHVRHENDSFSIPAADEIVDLSPLRSHIEAVEQEMLNELGAFIAAKVSEQTVSMVAQEISTGAKAMLARNDQGDPVLRLNLDYERAWATLGQALNNAEIEVMELDQETGVYQVRIPDKVFTGEEEAGFFDRVFSFGDGGAILVQLSLVSEGQNSYLVSVEMPEMEEMDRELTQQVLVLIREYAT